MDRYAKIVLTVIAGAVVEVRGQRPEELG